jgi:hypothetical protein
MGRVDALVKGLSWAGGCGGIPVYAPSSWRLAVSEHCLRFVQSVSDPSPRSGRTFLQQNSQRVTLGVFSPCFKPSSPRWFFFPGPLGRGFLCFRFLGVYLLLFGSLVGCGSVAIDDYADKAPQFAPADFFSGQLTAHGVVKDFRGKAIRHFNADIRACWDGGVGTLDEQFVFDDGERQTRIWTLTPDPDGGYVATAGDVVGEGNTAWRGNAMFLDYLLQLELDSGPFVVRIDDRMYRVSDDVVINESKMKKWGVTVGEILLTIVRHPELPDPCETS